MNDEHPIYPGKCYLGDSVYIQVGSYVGEIILTTENGLPGDPSNRIAMEAREVDGILRFLKRWKEMREASLDADCDPAAEISPSSVPDDGLQDELNPD